MANTTRTFITVNDEEILVTNALMMDYAIKALEETNAPAEVIVKAKTHLGQLTKKSDTPKGESQAAKENKRLASEVLKVMPADEPVLTSWIMEHVHFIATPQKCAKVMQILIDSGKVEKVEKVKGRYIGYKLV